MNYIELSMACRPLNAKYKELFGVVPTLSDYECTYEQYLNALTKAVFEQRPLEEYLKRAAPPDPSLYTY